MPAAKPSLPSRSRRPRPNRGPHFVPHAGAGPPRCLPRPGAWRVVPARCGSRGDTQRRRDAESSPAVSSMSHPGRLNVETAAAALFCSFLQPSKHPGTVVELGAIEYQLEGRWPAPAGATAERRSCGTARTSHTPGTCETSLPSETCRTSGTAWASKAPETCWWSLTTPVRERTGFLASPRRVPASSPAAAPDCSGEVLCHLHRHSEPKLPDPDRPPVPLGADIPPAWGLGEVRSPGGACGASLPDDADASPILALLRRSPIPPRAEPRGFLRGS